MTRTIAAALPAACLAFTLGAAALPARTSASEWSGVASYYGPGFHGRTTANGERFDQNAMTAAHRTLPFGTRLRVTNPATGKSVTVRINDRGPFHGNRVLDLSKGAAAAIGMVRAGVQRVRMERL